MMNCKEVTYLLSEAQDRPLGLTERMPLRLHLMMCVGCRNYGRQLDFLRLAARSHSAVRERENER